MLMNKDQLQSAIEKITPQLLLVKNVCGITNNGRAAIVHVTSKDKSTEDAVFAFLEKHNDELPYALAVVGRNNNLLRV